MSTVAHNLLQRRNTKLVFTPHTGLRAWKISNASTLQIKAFGFGNAGRLGFLELSRRHEATKGQTSNGIASPNSLMFRGEAQRSRRGR
jgi:hypothetical protein